MAVYHWEKNSRGDTEAFSGTLQQSIPGLEHSVSVCEAAEVATWHSQVTNLPFPVSVLLPVPYVQLSHLSTESGTFLCAGPALPPSHALLAALAACSMPGFSCAVRAR